VKNDYIHWKVIDSNVKKLEICLLLFVSHPEVMGLSADCTALQCLESCRDSNQSIVPLSFVVGVEWLVVRSLSASTGWSKSGEPYGGYARAGMRLD